MNEPTATEPRPDASAGPAGHVLVVDDEQAFCRDLCGVLAAAGHHARGVTSGEQALAALDAERTDLVLLDLTLKHSRLSGLAVLRRATAQHPDVAVVIVSGHGTIAAALEATRLGAYDFLEKPVGRERILLTVRNALDRTRLRRERNRLLEEAAEPHRLVGASAALRAVLDLADRAARTDCKVLITGESGSGKEVVARTVHRLSDRAGRPFVAINCAAFPTELVESELFGYEKGAFTGASQAHKGRFEQADGGTLFLDEIGDMSPSTQAKILRVLATGEVRPVGGEAARAVDVRVLAATHRDLRAEVRRGAFREDLYYRLNVLPIHVPPLRERAEDVPPLVAHFLRGLARRGLPLKPFTADAQALMAGYRWPGNVRELENVVERLVVLSDGPSVTAADVARLLGDGPSEAPLSLAGEAPAPARPDAPLQEALDAFERTYLVQALTAHAWRRQETAGALGIDRTQLWRKMQRHGIEPPEAPGAEA